MCDYHHLTIYQLKIVYQEYESYSKILVVESLLKYSEQSGLGFFNLLACLRHNNPLSSTEKQLLKEI